MGDLTRVVVTRLVRNCALGRVTQYPEAGVIAERPRRTGFPAFTGNDDE